jgi:hypothetical protein
MTVETESGKYPVVMFNTAYGDGNYPVLNDGVLLGNSGVDAGLLSFIPAELIEELEASDFLGTWVELPYDSKFRVEGGDAHVGPLFVDTCGCYEDEDGDDDEDVDEEDED